jgi:glycosyltransferase involved in cell wall biosynthesis
MLISVVLCTYNPSDKVIERALDAILSQDLDRATWELLVVDNNSSPAVSTRSFIADQGIRVVVEPKQGLSAARECGVRNTQGSILVFVDDDNLIAPNYLTTISGIFTDANIGVVSGAITPEYVQLPARWFAEFEEMLAIRRPPTEGPYLTNIPCHNAYFPIGAGMGIRRELIRSYYRSIAEGSVYLPGRVGSQLSSGEDIDLAFFAISQGYLVGTVGSLKLQHVIPPERTTTDYISRLAIASTRSAADVNSKWSDVFGGNVFESFNSSRRNILVKCLLACLLSWLPKFRVRYHYFKTLSEISRHGH